MISRGLVRDGRVSTPAGRRAQSQAASTLITAATTGSVTGSSGAPSASRVLSWLPQPMSVSRPRARPGSAVSSGGIFPAASTPSAFIPVGHIRRGSTVTPGRSSRSRAAVTLLSGTSPPTRCPVQLSQRPHATAAGSSSCRRRYSIRHPSVAR